jgi:hypothetical protein
MGDEPSVTCLPTVCWERGSRLVTATSVETWHSRHDRPHWLALRTFARQCQHAQLVLSPVPAVATILCAACSVRFVPISWPARIPMHPHTFIDMIFLNSALATLVCWDGRGCYCLQATRFITSTSVIHYVPNTKSRKLSTCPSFFSRNPITVAGRRVFEASNRNYVAFFFFKQGALDVMYMAMGHPFQCRIYQNIKRSQPTRYRDKWNDR